MTPSSETPAAPDGQADAGKHLTVYGRQGSPTVTVALPFSKIHVNDNEELAAQLCRLTELVQRLAEAAAQPRSAGRAELEAVAHDATELLEQLRR
jgi:hypothetical protein